MHSDLTQAEYDSQARALLAHLENEATTSTRHIPAPGPVAPGIAPFVVPDGYTVRETVETTADGNTRTIREVVPLAPPPAPTAPAPTPRPAPTPSAFAEHRALPQWLTSTRAKAKAIAYVTGAAAVTTVGAVYGADIATNVSAGATVLWHATLTVLKVGGICLAGALFLRLILGGSRRRTGTFEGSIKGTWRQD
ncbi:hypothetical protein ACFC0S_16325 [Streptomyces sp. NPDC056084]|uniref:hypothetical protein n=1 Tax=unclassified Streptomyces TaxID=2593676 RepID=UPI0035E1D585